jgi:hypothetical protein
MNFSTMHSNSYCRKLWACVNALNFIVEQIDGTSSLMAASGNIMASIAMRTLCQLLALLQKTRCVVACYTRMPLQAPSLPCSRQVVQEVLVGL